MKRGVSMSHAILKKEDYFRTDENIHIQLSKDFPDYIGIVHSHEYIEVMYIVSGTATHQIGNEKYRVKKGDLFIVNVGTTHAFYLDKNPDESFVAYDLMFTPEFFDSSINGYHPLEALNHSFMFRSLFTEQDTPKPYLSVTGSQYTAFGELFNKIYHEHQAMKKGYIDIIRAYLIELIITCFRLNDDKTANADLKNRRIIDFLTDFISQNYSHRLSVNELAKSVFLNPDYLGRIFKKQTGFSLTEMIQKVRIENACNMLRNTDKSVSEIAFLCGFEDVKFFYTVFKKRMGILPSDYRKTIKTK